MAGCSMLERLPEEIKLNICAQFETDGPHGWRGLYSLTALRLTSRTFLFLANDKIFRTIRLYPSINSLSALESVALHPEFSRHVQRLEVSSLYLPLCCSYSEWLERVKGYPRDDTIRIPREQEQIRLRDQHVPNNLQRHFVAYLRHRVDEKLFQNLNLSNLCLQIVTQLTRFPNLTSLIFWAVDHSTRWRGTNLTVLERETLLHRQPDEIRRLRDHVRILVVLFVAFHTANTKLKHLNMHRPSLTFFANKQWKPAWGWCIKKQDWSRPVSCSFFSAVEILELQCISTPTRGEDDNASTDAQDNDEDGEEALARFILAFRNLKILDLSFHQTLHGFLLFNVLGSSTRWPGLTQLTLHLVAASEEDFTNLLLAHKLSLRHLKMMEMFLVRGRWVSILHVLSTYSMLESVEFDFLLELEPDYVWWTKSPSTGQDLLSQLHRCILQKDEKFPLPLSDSPEDAMKAWSSMSDSSFTYESAEVMTTEMNRQFVDAEVSATS